MGVVASLNCNSVINLNQQRRVHELALFPTDGGLGALALKSGGPRFDISVALWHLPIACDCCRKCNSPGLCRKHCRVPLRSQRHSGERFRALAVSLGIGHQVRDFVQSVHEFCGWQIGNTFVEWFIRNIVESLRKGIQSGLNVIGTKFWEVFRTQFCMHADTTSQPYPTCV